MEELLSSQDRWLSIAEAARRVTTNLQLCWQEYQAATNVTANRASVESLEEERRQLMALRQEQQDRRIAQVRAREAEDRLARTEERAARRLTNNIADAERVADAILLAEAIHTGESRRPTRPRSDVVPRYSSSGESRNQLEEPGTRRGSRRGPASAEELIQQHQRRLARRRSASATPKSEPLGPAWFLMADLQSFPMERLHCDIVNV
uniref:Uncharacterized protein n=1 Tax=Anopheles farauti TaxID=69004 RepID=A0A182QMQ7_9DIPT